jgi:aerobic carbon-monoxide dehydrogenase small subunit
VEVAITVNGQAERHDVEPRTLLVQYLREECRRTGTKVGCDTSSCGACTVLLDGQPIRSCNTAVSQADGHSVTSLEGLRALDGLPNPDDLHPIQQAFVTQQALQCGYCVAGPVMYGYAFVRDNPNPSRSDIEQGLAGILCRCCSHTRMLNAIQSYAQEKSK